MTVLYQTTADDSVVDLSSGTGHVLVSHNRCEFRGLGPGRTVVTLDGSYPSAFQPTVGLSSMTIRDLTIDCAHRAEVLGALSSMSGGIGSLVLHNVEVLDMQRSGIAIVNQAELEATGLTVQGDGAAVQSTESSTATVLRGMTVVGGRAGFVNSAGALASTPGIDIDGADIDHGYFASPTYEAVTVTGFTDTACAVNSHVIAARSLYDCIRVLTPVLTFDTERTLRSPLVQLYDRAETADGRWAEVLGFLDDGTPRLSGWRASGSWRRTATPSAQATLYRPTLGRIFGWSSTVLMLRTGEGIPEQSRWRTVSGAAAATPSMVAGVRVDVIRHGASGGQTRDVDTGAIHITASADGAVVRNVSARRGFSDIISVRGSGGLLEGCSVSLGQDMGFTIDASYYAQTVRGCQATAIGNHGFYIAQFGGTEPSRIYDSAAYDNGTHGQGYGFGADVGAELTYIRGKGSGNFLGLAANCTVIEGAFDRPRRYARGRAWHR